MFKEITTNNLTNNRDFKKFLDSLRKGESHTTYVPSRKVQGMMADSSETRYIRKILVMLVDISAEMDKKLVSSTVHFIYKSVLKKNRNRMKIHLMFFGGNSKTIKDVKINNVMDAYNLIQDVDVENNISWSETKSKFKQLVRWEKFHSVSIISTYGFIDKRCDYRDDFLRWSKETSRKSPLIHILIKNESKKTEQQLDFFNNLPGLKCIIDS